MQSDLATRLRSIAKVLDDRVVPVVTGMGHVEAKICTAAAVGELRDLADEVEIDNAERDDAWPKG